MSAPDTTLNAFLGGRLQIEQPVRGYRAGIDPVLLAASIPARAGDTALDLGCGVGVAGLCLARRVPDVHVTGVEIQFDYAALARVNASRNDLAFDVTTGDIADLPKPLKERQFSHVFANPPYFDRNASTRAPNPGREAAMGEATPLADWVETATRRVAPGGTVTFIHRAENLPRLLTLMQAGLGSLTVLPLTPRRGRPARLVLVQAIKGGRADFRLMDAWRLHEGDRHEGDRESYTKATACVLRDGQALALSRQS